MASKAILQHLKYQGPQLTQIRTFNSKPKDNSNDDHNKKRRGLATTQSISPTLGLKNFSNPNLNFPAMIKTRKEKVFPQLIQQRVNLLAEITIVQKSVVQNSGCWYNDSSRYTEMLEEVEKLRASVHALGTGILGEGVWYLKDFTWNMNPKFGLVNEEESHTVLISELNEMRECLVREINQLAAMKYGR
jgi:hypothetical protein